MKSIVIKTPSAKQVKVMLVLLAGVIVFLVLKAPGAVLKFSERWQTLDGWQAVYLANGQVYVGRLRALDSHSVRLLSAYYVITQEGAAASNGQAGTIMLQNGNLQNLSLLRWGVNQPLLSSGELHFERSAVSFWETLNSDSQVVQQIETSRQ